MPARTRPASPDRREVQGDVDACVRMGLLMSRADTYADYIGRAGGVNQRETFLPAGSFGRNPSGTAGPTPPRRTNRYRFAAVPRSPHREPCVYEPFRCPCGAGRSWRPIPRVPRRPAAPAAAAPVATFLRPSGPKQLRGATWRPRPARVPRASRSCVSRASCPRCLPVAGRPATPPCQAAVASSCLTCIASPSRPPARRPNRPRPPGSPRTSSDAPRPACVRNRTDGTPRPRRGGEARNPLRDQSSTAPTMSVTRRKLWRRR